MGAGSPHNAYSATGRLAYGCTDLSAAWPHGGTGLGLTSSVKFAPPSGAVFLGAERDSTTRKVLYVGGDASLGARLVDWDADALQRIFPNFSTSNGEVLMAAGNDQTTLVEGQEFPTVAPLVFTPINSAHPGIIFYTAYCLLEQSASLWLSSRRWLEVPLLFLGKHDANGKVALWGTFSELNL